MKNKCYIAGKIGGLSVEEFTANFAEAKKEVIALGFEPVSPVDLPHNHNKSWEAYMKEDIIYLMQCTHIYVMRNWRTSPGATIEINLALQLGIHIIHQTPRREREPETFTSLLEHFESGLSKKTIIHWESVVNKKWRTGACGKKFTIQFLIPGEDHKLSSYASEVTCPTCLAAFNSHCEKLQKHITP